MYKLNYFNFKKFSNDEFLLTNDFGNFIFISDETFNKLTNKSLQSNDYDYNKLIDLGFIYEDEEKFFIDFVDKLRANKNALFARTKLHIFALTNKCNLGCVYCQAKSSYLKKGVMKKEDALKFVDIALSSPEKELDFEFQGGEPTLNFEILKTIVEYTETVKKDKIINYNLVTNLYNISDEMIDFLFKNNIKISTSLDGNLELHNSNRVSKENNSFQNLKNNIKRIKEYYKKNEQPFNIGAIQTTTKKSLNNPQKIIDTFIELGMDGIFLRPLSPLGNSIDSWSKIGYTANEFLTFYKNALDYIITLNKQGTFFRENNTVLFLKRIFQNNHLNYMELRSPCGAVIGQLAYNYDGNIYSCDEGRMLKEIGDEIFKVGDIYSKYEDVLNNPTTKSLLVSSCLETVPQCSSCVFNQYCGTCPVYNYIAQNNIFGKQPENYKCKINKGILEHIFYILRNDEESKKVITSWL